MKKAEQPPARLPHDLLASQRPPGRAAHLEIMNAKSHAAAPPSPQGDEVVPGRRRSEA
jgi:hypothetical protein